MKSKSHPTFHTATERVRQKLRFGVSDTCVVGFVREREICRKKSFGALTNKWRSLPGCAYLAQKYLHGHLLFDP